MFFVAILFNFKDSKQKVRLKKKKFENQIKLNHHLKYQQLSKVGLISVQLLKPWIGLLEYNLPVDISDLQT